MTSAVRKLAGELLRYGLAVAGPIASAGIQFVLALVLLRFLDPPAFGVFSFLLVASQFSWGVWGALFCAPLPALLTTADGTSHDDLLPGLFAGNLLGAAIAFGVFLAIAMALGTGLIAAAAFAAFAAIALLRWFARAHAYATGNPMRATVSDMVYSGVLLVGVALVAVVETARLEIAFAAMLASVAMGLLPFGRRYLGAQFTMGSFRSLGSYGRVWRRHARWSLLGVLTTEATANSHVYIVTLIAGPTAYAPIAASGLLIRPVTVAANALTEFERARMARQIGDGRVDQALRSVRFFRVVLVAVWVATALAAAWLLAFAPHVVFPRQYSFETLAIGTALWMVVAVIRLLRTPESVLLQAFGAFRPLAYASVMSSSISVAAVIALLVLVNPLWSVAGVLVGEAAFAGWIWLQTRRWLAADKAAIKK